MVSPEKEERAILQALRQGTAPATVKRQASRGTVPVAAGELLEILVLLTSDPDPTCSEEAKKTLAGWPMEKCAALLSEPEISAETLAYFAAKEELPGAAVESIAAHPHADDHVLALLASRLPVEQLRQIAADAGRLEALPGLVGNLLERKDLPADLRKHLEDVHLEQAQAPEKLAEVLSREEDSEAQAPPEEKHERVSLTQKIARLSVSERVQLALKGNRDERMILIRDPSKVVYRAVLQSPKLTDSEVESFASMKNIAEEALRIMAGNRKFIKSYVVVRSLVNNPRTPIDVSLPLLNRFTEQDLKFLTKNRNVPETLRSMAVKLHKQRSTTRGGGSFH
jgi:hypothetical protein